MSEIVTAIDAYQRKAQAIASVLAPRIGGHYWDGYSNDEPLEGEMVDLDTVRFWRRGRPNGGNITFGFIAPVEASELSRTPPRIIKQGIQEVYAWDIDVLAGSEYDETLEHEFARTVTEMKAWQGAWKVAAEASLGWAPSYQTGGVAASIKVNGEYGQTDSTSTTTAETTRDRVSRRFVFTGPKRTRVEARRSRNTEERSSTIAVSNTAKVYFYNGSSQYEWRTIDLLIAAIKGREPLHTNFTPFGGSSSLRQKMIDQPASKDELDVLGEESDQRFEIVFRYDDVTHQTIQEVAVGDTQAF